MLVVRIELCWNCRDPESRANSDARTNGTVVAVANLTNVDDAGELEEEVNKYPMAGEKKDGFQIWHPNKKDTKDFHISKIAGFTQGKRKLKSEQSEASERFEHRDGKQGRKQQQRPGGETRAMRLIRFLWSATDPIFCWSTIQPSDDQPWKSSAFHIAWGLARVHLQPRPKAH